VHFALNATTLALIVSRLTGVPFSFTAHANDIFANPIMLAEKIANANMINAISDYNARFLCDFVPDPRTRAEIRVVRCGIDVTDFAPTKRPSPNEEPTILAVGRLVEKKGYPYLIEACGFLADRGHRFRCLIVGDGPQQALLQKMIDERELNGVVQLIGPVFQEHLKEYLAQADIITLPCVVAQDGDMDGIPNSLMEGMAMEIPAVSTRLSGIPELIDHLENGLLVEPNDAAGLADALALLLDDAELRLRLGRAARAKIVAEYEIGANADRLLEIFRDSLRSGPDVERHPARGKQPQGASAQFERASR
jgi:glycosyltransferase involved in cell wall biosynthesis